MVFSYYVSFSFFQTAATRVVLLDSHFNPAVSSQCISRSWRLGQEKPVHVYRFAITDSLETKVYKRAENKSIVSSGVVDGEDPLRNFTRDECSRIQEIGFAETCDNCGDRHLFDESEYCVQFLVFFSRFLVDNFRSFTLCFSRSTHLCPGNYPRKIGRKFVCENVGKTCVALATTQDILTDAAAEEDPILLRLVAVVEKKIRKRPFVCGIDKVRSTTGTSKRRRLSES